MTTDTQTALTNFVAAAQAMLDDHHAKHYPTLPRTVLVCEQGRRYTRIWKDRGGHRSAYCFVDQNGDILKAASYKAPAKHARGSIFSENPLSAVSVYGANYLR